MHKYSVAAIKRLTPTIMLLTLTPKRKRDRLRFTAGQYAALGFTHGGRPSPMRCFSIVSSPNQPDSLQFAIRIIGDFTHTVAQLRPGDNVLVRGPFGNFIVDEQFDRNLVLMAGGIGITPFMSMIRAHAEQRSSKPMTLLYSCSSQDNIPFYEELLELERRDERLRIAFFVTNGPVDKLAGARILTDRIGTEHLERVTGGMFNACTYFLCGPKPFIEALRDGLHSKGAESERIVSEEFSPAKADRLAFQPGWNVRHWTYGLTGATLVMATAFIMSLDLARYVPKLASNVTTKSTVAATQSTAQATTADDSTAATTTVSAPTATATQTTPTITKSTASSSSAPTPAPTAPVTYHPPVTSVS